MGRNYSRKHVSDLETAHETVITVNSCSIIPCRTGKESQSITVQAGMYHDVQIDDTREKVNTHQKIRVRINLTLSGGPSGTRTPDQPVMSRLL